VVFLVMARINALDAAASDVVGIVC
jgi:hypothetical protein